MYLYYISIDIYVDLYVQMSAWVFIDFLMCVFACLYTEVYGESGVFSFFNFSLFDSSTPLSFEGVCFLFSLSLFTSLLFFASLRKEQNLNKLEKSISLSLSSLLRVQFFSFAYTHRYRHRQIQIQVDTGIGRYSQLAREVCMLLGFPPFLACMSSSFFFFFSFCFWKL